MGELRSFPGFEDMTIIASSLCPRDTVYVMTAPPDREAFATEARYREAVTAWEEGIYAIEFGPEGNA